MNKNFNFNSLKYNFFPLQLMQEMLTYAIVLFDSKLKAPSRDHSLATDICETFCAKTNFPSNFATLSRDSLIVRVKKN